MMKARVGTNKTLFFFDAGAVVVTPSLLTAQIKQGATIISTLTFSLTAGVPNLYRSSALLLTASGQYEVVFRYNGTAVSSDYIDVDAYPVTDYPIGQSASLKYPGDVIGTGETVSARLVTSTGTVGSSIPAPYSSATAAYEAPATFPAAGDYCVVWYQVINSTVTPIAAEPAYLAVPTGREVVKFVAGDGTDLNVSLPYVMAKLVVTDLDGNWVAQTVTDSQRMARLELPPGKYRASLLKDPYVYSVNNFNFSVETTPAIPNTIHLNTSAVSVTVSPEQQPAPVCRLYADLYRMSGTPLIGAVVRVSLLHRPQLFGGTPVFDTDLGYKTDAHGHVEFDLVQGIQVEVSIAPLSLRRIVTVPSGQDAANPVNLMTLMSQAPDLFEIIAPNIPAAAKRSL